MSLFRVPVSLVALLWVQIDCINCTYDWFRRTLDIYRRIEDPLWALYVVGKCPPIALFFGTCAVVALFGAIAAWQFRRKVNLGSHKGSFKPALWVKP